MIPTVIKRRILRWLGGVDIETYTKIMTTNLECHNDTCAKILELEKEIDANKLVCTLGQYKYELVLKHGCLDCFSVDGEWHKDDCRFKGEIVRRENGKQPTGKC